MKVKVGMGKIVADPLDDEVTEVELPDEHYRVLTGAIREGDMFLNCVLLRDGIVAWEPADTRDNRKNCKCQHGPAGAFACLIRRGTPVDKLCERCEQHAAYGDMRYCWQCAEVIRQSIREQNRP